MSYCMIFTSKLPKLNTSEVISKDVLPTSYNSNVVWSEFKVLCQLTDKKLMRSNNLTVIHNNF